MYFDLTGLPPAPEEMTRWSSHLSGSGKDGNSQKTDVQPDAVGALANELLNSPRHGERWAQHWLDVVRYADTHGFEVNTPRDNAWPYRDYVIRSFNENKPYDQFIFEQLAGDTVGEDAATGFLVAAAVLLPGQIGKDEESKRLARQDSLNEIIVGTSETFLGLTVGCARCHDHKFDPISQKDYYAMQAFFAGVDYGDRPMNSPAHQKRSKEAETLLPKLTKLEQQLKHFEPLVLNGRTILIDDEDLNHVTLLKTKAGHGTNPDGDKRGYKDDPGSTTRLPNLSRTRYTWWKHQPGEDVFTYNPATDGTFDIWLSWGAHGSGVHTRDARYVLDRDGDLKTREDQAEIAKVDQYYFANVSQGASEKKPLWSGFIHAGRHRLTEDSRIIVRGGETGTGVTADVILLQETAAIQAPSPPSGERAGVRGRPNPPKAPDKPALPRLRAPANPLENIERFSPTKTRFIRFTTLATMKDNFREPCIDELEVFTTGDDSKNIALSNHGTTVTSSGNYSNTGKHQFAHINDGRYGNSFSWISNEKGRGWVQLELKEPATIDRIIWARDREGKFKDRLPVEYCIEVALEPGKWTTVAHSNDRAPQGTPADGLSFRLRNLTGKDAEKAKAVHYEHAALRKRIDSLKKPELVYAGLFRKPDETFVLNRGDPEQKTDRVAPRTLGLLRPVSLQQEAPEKERRVALARWIASPENPLTARVMVNRIWQYHFGHGLVDTASDFGLNGTQPTHPELLDWLASEFMVSGWSVKHIHKLILASATYQQSGRIDPKAQKADGDTRLLWRFPSRRLEGEAIRDSMLTVSGRLNLKMGGPGFSFFKSRGGLSGFPPVEKFGPEEYRRMIYSHKIRMERVPVFGAFDCPDAGQPMPTRSRSTTAIQALNLFNSPFVAEQAIAFAERVKSVHPKEVELQVVHAYELALGRQPNQTESHAAIAAVKEHGLPTLCRALFNSSEFLFLP